MNRLGKKEKRKPYFSTKIKRLNYSISNLFRLKGKNSMMIQRFEFEGNSTFPSYLIRRSFFNLSSSSASKVSFSNAPLTELAPLTRPMAPSLRRPKVLPTMPEEGAAQGNANKSRTDDAGTKAKKIAAKSSLETFLSIKSLEDESITL